ncbi:MAG: response regulator transcription factor [Desulfobacterales bacterium]|nr:response regulator transcription factor [Desulfobacterales bacterium]
MNFLIADDHQLLRRGVIQIIAEEYPYAHFGEASTTTETLLCLSQRTWNLLILDIFMPGRSGLEVLSEVRRMHSPPPILVLSSAPEDQMAIRVLKAGAHGYLNKQTAPENLIKAVHKILSGGRYASDAIADQLLNQIGRKDSNGKWLSDREYSVLQHLVSGKTISQIASELSLSPKTISTYHIRIWEKLHVKNDAEMIRYTIEKGLDHLKT